MKNVLRFLRAHQKVLLISVGAVLGVVVIGQLLYPADRLLPFASIDGHSFSMWRKQDTAHELNRRLNSQAVGIYLNDQSAPVTTVHPDEIGLSADSKKMVEEGSDYPFIVRLIPFSVFWHGAAQADSPYKYEREEAKAQAFVDKQFGRNCVIKPQNASIQADGESLDVVPAKDGGVCGRDEVLAAVKTVKPTLRRPGVVRADVTITKPAVETSEAKRLATLIETETGDGVKLQVADSMQTIPRKELFSWLETKPDKASLKISLSAKKADRYLTKTVRPKVTKPAGTTYVTTRDFTTLSKKVGLSGKTLDNEATLANLTNVMLGKADKAVARITTLKPTVKYTRSYTKTSTGIAALITHYDQDNPGTFGVSFRELGGRGLSAQHNADKAFHSASTYKLFVAYGTLKKIEKNDWEWSDKILGSKTVDQCFEVMIVNSDNPCAEALYKKIGYQKTINDVRALGMPNTTLPAGGQQTTAGDLAVFLSKLESGTIGLKSSSRAKLLSAMKRNVYRQGVPAGASGTVADKVGFLNGLLHDAAIVYSPKGTYVLTVMSNGSSWGAIAELTRKIEALR